MSNSNQTSTELVLIRTLGSTSIGLKWDFAVETIGKQDIDLYHISCHTQQNLTFPLQGQEEILNHMISFDISGNTTTATIQGLLPARSYNCCVTADTANSCTQAMTNGHGQSSEISATLAGLVGGILGVVITLMALAVIVAIVMGTVITARRKRAITRAKSRPVLRTESTVYRRSIRIGKPTLATENNTQTDSPPTIKQSNTLPHTNRESQIRQPAESVTNTSAPTALLRTAGKQGQLYTIPNSKKNRGNQPMPPDPVPRKQPAPRKLKPMVPLKPPIQDDRPRPLRRAKSQPDSSGFRVDMAPETMEAEHIYDTAEVSDNLTLRVKRIVSTDNVAYTQPTRVAQGTSDGDWNQEYEPIF